MYSELSNEEVLVEEVIETISKKYHELSVDCQKDIVSIAKVKYYQKGEVVAKEGDYSKNAYLILKGCSRAYYLKDGKDISDWFSFEHEFMAAIVSFFGDTPSPHYLEFLEDAVVLQFTKTDMDAISSKHHDFERFINKIVTETLLGLCQRLYTIQFTKAEDRYKQLLGIYPDIQNRVPLTHIASYLGITLETLSRIRSAISRI